MAKKMVQDKRRPSKSKKKASRRARSGRKSLDLTAQIHQCVTPESSRELAML